MNVQPRLAITMGEATGIGPELALRVCGDPDVRSVCKPMLFGDAGVFSRVARTLGLDVPEIVPCGRIDADSISPGVFSATTGRASFETVCHAIDAACRGDVDAIVTGPIQKEAWHAAGIDFPGHTELLALRAGTAMTGQPADVRMMLAADKIACVLETIHVPLADVPGMLNVNSLVRTITLAGDAVLRRNRSAQCWLPPRIAVLGLNPHAGENGLFSHGEESRVIGPAIQIARDEGWDVVGPLPPDTAFVPAMRANIDVFVCMYHDQGLIPLKALAFDEAVNVTLGLPIVRTSVDHGTAMDLAWQGKASDRSLVAAIRLAAAMASRS